MENLLCMLVTKFRFILKTENHGNVLVNDIFIFALKKISVLHGECFGESKIPMRKTMSLHWD